jgi:hypothetical protein
MSSLSASVGAQTALVFQTAGIVRAIVTPADPTSGIVNGGGVVSDRCFRAHPTRSHVPVLCVRVCACVRACVALESQYGNWVAGTYVLQPLDVAQLFAPLLVIMARECDACVRVCFALNTSACVRACVRA